MLARERQEKIINLVNLNKTISVIELSQTLNISESTIRRDLITLSEMGKLVKVHGGATAKIEDDIFIEPSIESKAKLNNKEKDIIAEYAASLITDSDFVFIDAGTTTEKMIEYITNTKATFVTNGYTHAKKLSRKNLKVYIVGGRLKEKTEAIIGSECIMALKKYNFTKCFIGTNGITQSGAFTTPDADEANVKSTAIEHSRMPYILADSSKFGQISLVTFASNERCCVITDKLKDKKFADVCSVKEVL